METAFPFQIVEMANGVLAISLLWMFVFLALHLHHAWRILSTHWGSWKGFFKLWQTNKPEIALITFIGAFFFRTLMLWYVRWVHNHHYDGLYVVVVNDAIALIALTAIMIVGISCWIRVISPTSGRNAVLLWCGMMFTSLLFGIGMHQWF